MAQANENDEEVLEQLVQAAETGDVALLRTLLTDHHEVSRFVPVLCRQRANIARPTASILETNPVDRRRIVHFADG